MFASTKTKHGFTLLEVVLAIGLTAVVLGLLTTAMELYLFRVDASRVHVESSQLARSLLNQIARDLRATRYRDTSLASSPSSPEVSSGGGEDASGGAPLSNASSTTDAAPATGMLGTATELRLDRTAKWSWNRATREIDTSEGSAEADVPFSVRYFVRDGKTFSAEDLAAEGVGEKLSGKIAGLCRERTTTAGRQLSGASSDSLGTADPERVELLAPEVFEIEFAYLDGTELVDEWDSTEEKALPRAVEIRLKVIEKPFEAFTKKPVSLLDANRVNEKDLIEYRLLVHLPRVQPPHKIAAKTIAPPSTRSSENNNSNQNESSPNNTPGT